jgi:phage terminase small subunit
MPRVRFQPNMLLVKGGGKARKRDQAFVDSSRTGRPSVGPPPQHFSEAQQAVWREVVGSVPEGHLTASDSGALEAYAVALDTLRRLTQRFNADGGSFFDDHGRRDDGAAATAAVLRELRSSSRLVGQLGRELGLVATHRQRVTLPPPPIKDDPLERFFGIPR